MWWVLNAMLCAQRSTTICVLAKWFGVECEARSVIVLSQRRAWKFHGASVGVTHDEIEAEGNCCRFDKEDMRESAEKWEPAGVSSPGGFSVPMLAEEGAREG